MFIFIILLSSFSAQAADWFACHPSKVICSPTLDENDTPYVIQLRSYGFLCRPNPVELRAVEAACQRIGGRVVDVLNGDYRGIFSDFLKNFSFRKATRYARDFSEMKEPMKRLWRGEVDTDEEALEGDDEAENTDTEADEAEDEVTDEAKNDSGYEGEDEIF